jgi:hypothetical protein
MPLYARYGVMGLNVFPDGFWFCFGSIHTFFLCSSSSLFGIGMFALCHCILEDDNFLFHFVGGQR